MNIITLAKQAARTAIADPDVQKYYWKYIISVIGLYLFIVMMTFSYLGYLFTIGYDAAKLACP